MCTKRQRETTEDTAETHVTMGHRNPNNTFFITGKYPTGHCEQYKEAKTVEQVLISWRKYVKERGEMYTSFQRLGRAGTGVRNLLGYGDT